MRLLRLLGVAALAAAPAMAPASAQADETTRLTVVLDNQTANPLQFHPAGDQYCWDNRDLEDGRIVPAGASSRYLTEARTEFFGDCRVTNLHFRGIGLHFRAQDNQFHDPVLRGPRDALPTEYEHPWQLTFHRDIPNEGDDPENTWQMRGIYDRWLPQNPFQNGSDPAPGASGAFCIDDVRATNGELHFTVEDEIAEAGNCKSPRELTFSHPFLRVQAGGSRTTTAAVAPQPAPGDAGSGQVVALFEIGRTACAMLKPYARWFFPGTTANCSLITSGDQWDLTNVTADTRAVKPNGDPQPTRQWSPLGDFQFTAGNTKGSLGYEYKWTQGQTVSSETEDSWHWDASIKFSEEVKFPGEIFTAGSEQEFAFGHDWTTTKATEHADEVEQTSKGDVEVQPNGTTYLRAYQQKGDLAFNFNADLSVGKANVAETLATAMSRQFGMSAARTHPCVGYLIGPGDPRSLQGLGAQANAQGFSESTPGLPADQKTFLRALGGLSHDANDRCPGWPDGYPGAAAYKGQATVHATGGGPAPNLAWVQPLASIKYCSWFKPANPSSVEAKRRAEAGEETDPCVDHGEAPPHSAPPGTAYAAADRPNATRIAGDDGHNLILGHEGGVAESLRGGAGNDVIEGSSRGHAMHGGKGDDIVTGDDGADVLRGGDGDDTLKGHAGGDVLRDGAGENHLDGGRGRDRLWTSGRASGGLLGGPGADLLTLRGDGPIALRGGPGNDRYRLKRGAKPRRVVELAGEGFDTIEAERSLRLPPFVERAVGKTAKGISLKGGPGDQILIGGPGDDLLAGRTGTDRLVGRRGDDLLLLGRHGFDRARGGRGADRFVPRAIPVTEPLPEGFRPRTAPSAHLIADLRPRQGDRLVLTRSSFGPELRELGRRLIVRNGPNPEPKGKRPQLLFDRRDSLLRFNPNGTGPLPAQVVAILRGFKRAPVGAITVKR